LLTPYLTQPLAHGADIVVHSLNEVVLADTASALAAWWWTADASIGPPASIPSTRRRTGSYHGLRWGIDLPAPLKPLAFILRMRTVPLRNLGACIAPDNSWFSSRHRDRSRCASSAL